MTSVNFERKKVKSNVNIVETDLIGLHDEIKESNPNICLLRMVFY